MKKLTTKKVLEVVDKFRDEWIDDFDWWYGDETSFTNAEYGYDMNVFEPEEGANRKVVIYRLGPKEEDGLQFTTDEIVLSFEIEDIEEFSHVKK